MLPPTASQTGQLPGGAFGQEGDRFLTWICRQVQAWAERRGSLPWPAKCQKKFCFWGCLHFVWNSFWRYLNISQFQFSFWSILLRRLPWGINFNIAHEFLFLVSVRLRSQRVLTCPVLVSPPQPDPHPLLLCVFQNSLFCHHRTAPTEKG